MAVDRRTRILLIAGALAAIAAALAAQGWGPRARPAARGPVTPTMLCSEQREAAERSQHEALRRRQAVLVARLEAGADPVRDAAAAAARGDFRLIRGITMMGTYALGVDCATAAENNGSVQPLTLATRFYSDVGGSCETQGGGDPCRTERLLDSYGPTYNRAIVANPLYPYGDLCRPAADGVAMRRIADPADYGFPDLAPTETPHDLHEAARRGTAAAVARMIAAAGTAGVDRADPYGLTPLAWAVIRHRPDVADRLMAAGASPVGADDCEAPDRPQSPLRLALRTGQEALARRMMTPVAIRRLRPWPGGLLDAAAQGGSASILSQMLREDHEGAAPDRIGRASGGDLPASSLAVIEDYSAGLCWRHRVPAGTRLRMVGVYQGANDSGSRSRHGMGRVTVYLAPSSRPVLLVLSAYEPVEWRIVRSPGARLAGVLALGMHRSRMTGAGAGVPVLINDRRDRCSKLEGAQLYAYEIDEQRQLAEPVERMIGRPVDDFQGSYSGTGFQLR
ncbi:MAG TPA: hypothetical protein VF574_01230 [Allosphingosinicella sp.]|jgi:hypothetical protein